MGLTEGCYSEGDSQELPEFIHPRGIPTISFQQQTLLSKHKGIDIFFFNSRVFIKE